MFAFKSPLVLISIVLEAVRKFWNLSNATHAVPGFETGVNFNEQLEIVFGCCKDTFSRKEKDFEIWSFVFEKIDFLSLGTL
jgi:hypothetical protein